jgi:hypothetical protein
MLVYCPYCSHSVASNKALQAHIAQSRYCRQNDEEAALNEPDSDLEHVEPTNINPFDDFTLPALDEADLGNNGLSPHSPSPKATIEDTEDDSSSDPKSIYEEDDCYVYTMKYPGPAGMPLNNTPVLTEFEKTYKQQVSENIAPWSPFQSEKE